MNIRHFISALKRKLYKNPRPALNDLDRKLEKYLSFENGFFIEAGANDGYNQSNTYFLEKRKNWRGLLVEGIPELYEKCKKERNRSRVVNCALVSRDYPSRTVTMHYANLMSVVHGSLKSDNEQQKHIAAGITAQQLNASYTIEVPARTLESLLDEMTDLSRIDFLSLDVEGYELDVLKGLNLSRYRPKYMLIEARFFEEIDNYLTGQHYRMVEQLSYHDYLYTDSR